MPSGGADLQDRVNKAHELSKERADKLSQKSDEVSEEASALWRTAKANWNTHVQHLHDNVADKRARLDLRAALGEADSAERYAASAVDFALSAIE